MFSHSSTENIINYMEIDIERDKFDWTAIRDNRDLSVARSHHQKTERLMAEMQTQTFNDDLLWLKIRNLIIRAIAASHNLESESVQMKDMNNCNSKSETNGTEKRSTLSVLTELYNQFQEYIKSTQNNNFAQHMVSCYRRLFE